MENFLWVTIGDQQFRTAQTKHIPKAFSIILKDFEQIIDPDNHLFGTFFTLKGNVATNFQFYLTDSTHNFIRGEVLMNSRPNYDSLRPSLDYLKIDLLSMVKSLKWKK
jgi:gliding motility-associated lipoprotein GldD